MKKPIDTLEFYELFPKLSREVTFVRCLVFHDNLFLNIRTVIALSGKSVDERNVLWVVLTYILNVFDCLNQNAKLNAHGNIISKLKLEYDFFNIIPKLKLEYDFLSNKK